MTSSTAPAALTVSVRLFARYAEVVGEERVEIALPTGATVADLLAVLRLQLPGFAVLPARPLCAVNLAHVLPSHTLRDGDEVAILPPLAGG
jgi:molybdopterin converting factor small subunit